MPTGFSPFLFILTDRNRAIQVFAAPAAFLPFPPPKRYNVPMQKQPPYQSFDYATRSPFMAEETKLGLFEYLRSCDADAACALVDWLAEAHESFLFRNRAFLLPRLAQFGHAEACERLAARFGYCERIAASHAFCLALSWTPASFSYFAERLAKAKPSEALCAGKAFWSEFLAYRFCRDAEIHESLALLPQALEKVPFYAPSPADPANAALACSRKNFFAQTLPKLSAAGQGLVLASLGSLLAQAYPAHQSLFDSEFAGHPLAIEAFAAALQRQNLNSALPLCPGPKTPKGL